MTVAHKKENTLLINKMLAKFRKPQSQFTALMPISALSLSACGGGGGTTPIETSTVINGSVLKGQITNALVFSDLNSNGIFDTAEPSAFTDENGNFNLELGCSTNFDLIVNAPGHQPNSFIINATQNYDKIISKTVYLNSQEEFEIVRNKKMVKINPINFDLNMAEITEEAAIELDKVVAILQNYPTIKIETKSHTDSRAPDNYNLELSNRRATSVISYIISKGIDRARIYGKGYGETELVNGCSNGVKCTEKEHQLNRRTEFKIIAGPTTIEIEKQVNSEE